MHSENVYDPNKKNTSNSQNEGQQDQEDGVYLYNDDGTPMDTSDRTYISVDLPEQDAGEASEEKE